MHNKIKFLSTLIACLALTGGADACTGITLKSSDGATVVARTMDWSRVENNSMYVIVPRGHSHQSLLPDGTMDGMKFVSLYGYASLAAVGQFLF